MFEEQQTNKISYHQSYYIPKQFPKINVSNNPELIIIFQKTVLLILYYIEKSFFRDASEYDVKLK